LCISTILLFVYSLSNRIAFGTFQIFAYQIPDPLVILTTSFRSSGRFAWPLVLFLFIWLSSVTSKYFSPKKFNILLLSVFLFHFIDIAPQLTSQKNVKFEAEFNSKLTNSGWNSIKECYSKIRVYPPTAGVDDYYDFVNLAEENACDEIGGKCRRQD
jgi:hypothetical protein